MTIDKSALKALAEDAVTFAGLNGEVSYAQEQFIAAAKPASILALLAEVDQLTAQLCVCPDCHGQGEIYTGRNSYEGQWQPPEPIMEKCGECDGEGVIGTADDLASLLSERDQLKTENEYLKAQLAQAIEFQSIGEACLANRDELRAKLGLQRGDNLHEHVEALRVDAMRYRFLRKEESAGDVDLCVSHVRWKGYSEIIAGVECDERIDTAMRKTPSK